MNKKQFSEQFQRALRSDNRRPGYIKSMMRHSEECSSITAIKNISWCIATNFIRKFIVNSVMDRHLREIVELTHMPHDFFGIEIDASIHSGKNHHIDTNVCALSEILGQIIEADIYDNRSSRTKRLLEYLSEEEIVRFDKKTLRQYEKSCIETIFKEARLTTDFYESVYQKAQKDLSEQYSKLPLYHNVKNAILDNEELWMQVNNIAFTEEIINNRGCEYVNSVGKLFESIPEHEFFNGALNVFVYSPSVFFTVLFFCGLKSAAHYYRPIEWVLGEDSEKAFYDKNLVDVITPGECLLDIRERDVYSERGHIDSPVSVYALARFLGHFEITTPIQYSENLTGRLESLGVSEMRARDIAIVVGTLRAVQEERLNDVHPCYELSMIDLFPEDELEADLIQESQPERIENPSEDVQRLKSEIERLTKENVKLNRILGNKEAIIQRQTEKIEKMESAIEQLESISETDIAETDSANDDVASETIPEYEYPYHTDKKIILFGGFDSFKNELKKLIPNIRIVPAGRNNIDQMPFRTADMIFVQTNNCGHSRYWAIKDVASKYNVPLYHLENAGAKCCADYIVQRIENLS